MTGLALRSLRHRAAAFVASFVTILLGTVLVGSFATLAETASGPVPDTDADTLTIMGAVVGSWGTVIVLFSLASTLGIAVRQRDVEVAMLRTIGSTPRQVRRMIRVETLLVAVVAAGLGVPIALVTGRVLFEAIRAGGLVSEETGFGGSLASVSAVALAMVLTSLVSATVAGRRATAGTAGLALREGRAAGGRMPWWRVAAGLLLVGYGIVMAVVTVTVTADSDDPYAAMSTSGSSSILVGVGLAALSPTLLRWFATATRPMVRLTGPTGELAAYNASRRSHLLAGVLAPVVVLTAAATGTLMLVGIDGRTLAEELPDSETITLLNNVVVGMISLFAGIMVVNSFAAVISHRRAELARLRLVGATPQQVRGSVLAEAGLVAAAGVVLGTLASLASIVPFSIARDEGVVPDGQLWLPVVLAAAAVVVTLGSAHAALNRAGSGSPLALAGGRQ